MESTNHHYVLVNDVCGVVGGFKGGVNDGEDGGEGEHDTVASVLRDFERWVATSTAMGGLAESPLRNNWNMIMNITALNMVMYTFFSEGERSSQGL